MRGDNVQSLDVSLIYCLACVNPSGETVIDRSLHLADVNAKAAGGICLRIGINQQYASFQSGQTGSEVHRGRGLAHAPLLVG